jgi:Zn-dependent alcohol dehydrogenase
MPSRVSVKLPVAAPISPMSLDGSRQLPHCSTTCDLASPAPGLGGGTAVLVGVARPEATLMVMDALLPGSKTFEGTNGGSPRPDRDLPMYVRWFQEGKLPLDLLVSRRYTLDQINEGVGALERGEILGRAIVEF